MNFDQINIPENYLLNYSFSSDEVGKMLDEELEKWLKGDDDVTCNTD